MDCATRFYCNVIAKAISLKTVGFASIDMMFLSCLQEEKGVEPSYSQEKRFTIPNESPRQLLPRITHKVPGLPAIRIPGNHHNHSRC
jgi:hypothetical protein